MQKLIIFIRLWTLKRRSEVRGGTNIIQLHYKGNLRYVLFEVEGQSYLLDRRPSHFIGYLSLPLNWLFYQKVYAITNEERSRLETKHSKASKFVIPTSLVGGAVVFFNAWTRVHNVDIFGRFNMDLSKTTKLILLALGFILAYILIQLLYSSRRKNIERLFGKLLSQPLYYKMQPVHPIRFFFKILGLRIFEIVLSIICLAVFLYLGNVAFLIETILAIAIFIVSAGGAFSPNEKWQYKIVDIRKSSGNNGNY